MANLTKLNLTEYGVYRTPLQDKLEVTKGAKCVVVALNNADTDGVLLQLLESAPEKVFGGMKLIKEEIGASEMVLHLPKNAAELQAKLEKQACDADVSITLGLVNIRANKTNFISHIVTMVDLYEMVNGIYEDGVYVSVNGGELKKVPTTTTVRELVGSDVKGVRTGYVIRGKEALDLTVDEVELENGVLNAITDSDCVVSLVDNKLQLCREQSCGKCVFCREGLLQLEAMQKDMTIGKGRLDEIDMTFEIGEAMTFSTPCSMGQKSSLLPMTAIDVFKAEYTDHIKKHKCSANVCKAFQKVYIDPIACIGCAKCIPVCKEDAIDGAEGYIHIVFDNGCTKCGACVDSCDEKAIHITTGVVPKLPYKMMRVGRFRK